MKTAVIYARVSSREQAEGFSIDAQVKACKVKASQESFKVLEVLKMKALLVQVVIDLH